MSTRAPFAVMAVATGGLPPMHLALHRLGSLTLRDDRPVAPITPDAPIVPAAVLADGHADTDALAHIDAPPKRKSTADGQAAPSAPNIARHDSGQLSVRAILLSRLLGTRDEAQLLPPAVFSCFSCFRVFRV